jgi:hypothetical protein
MKQKKIKNKNILKASAASSIFVLLLYKKCERSEVFPYFYFILCGCNVTIKGGRNDRYQL